MTTPAANWPVAAAPLELTGATASVLAAAAACDAIVFDPAYPRRPQAVPERNAFGRLVESVDAPDARSAVAMATGMSLAGERVAVFLTSGGCAAATDLLAEAVGRHAPLVVHLVCRALPSSGRPRGTGHEILERVRALGCGALVPFGVQEGLDLAMAAHRAAERALVPVVVALDADEIAGAREFVTIPHEALLREVLGEPSDVIAAPSVAQRLLLGDARRLVPRWYDLDRPVLLGPIHGPEAAMHAVTGNRWWFGSDLAQHLEAALRDVGAVTRRPVDLVCADDARGAKTVLVSTGSLVELARNVASSLRDERCSIGVVGIRCIAPLPISALVAAFARARTIAVLERDPGVDAAPPPLARAIRQALMQTLSRKAPHVVSVSAGLGCPVREDDLRALVAELEAGPRHEPARSRIWLGTALASAELVYPKRQACLDGLRRAEPDLVDRGLRAPRAHPATRPADASANAPRPARLDTMRRVDSTIDSLPRFWDQVGVLYRDGATDALAPDPYLGVGAVPALASALLTEPTSGAQVAFFDPETFDGDARLWTDDADGAVAAVAIRPRALIEAGLALAAEAGHAADALRSVVANLERAMRRVIADSPATTAGDLMRASFTRLMEQGGSAAKRREALEPALEAVADAVGPLPIARTEALFDDPEAARAGDGALLAVVMHPDQLRSADDLIAQRCGRGVRGEPRSAETLARARALWAIWERLPDTPGEVIDRARHDARIGPLGAWYLSRHCLFATARTRAEPASGAALALRHVLALAEAHLQPLMQQHLQRIAARRTELADGLRTALADALPVDDLDAMARGLESMGDTFELTELSHRVESAVNAGHVDAGHLRRLVDLARELADLDWRVGRGADGLGRARAGIVIASPDVASWTATFPENPFVAPAITASPDEGVALAAGLVRGHVRRTLHGSRLLRWAREEIDHPEDGAQAIERLAGLRYDELEAEEAALCPPVLLVIDEAALRGAARSAIEWMLRAPGRRPVKVVLLDGLEGLAAAGDDAGFDLTMSTCLGGAAYVAQCTVTERDHLADSVSAALRYGGPALIRIHAPRPCAHGFEPARAMQQAALAVAARVMPLLTFDPSRPGVLGSRFELRGGDAASAPWAVEHARAAFEAWAEQETRFCETDLGRAAEGVHRRWRMLQELAGVTPFTDRLRAAIESEMAAAHAARIEALERDHAAEIADLRARVEDEATVRVTQGLMVLAGFGDDVPSNGEAVP